MAYSICSSSPSTLVQECQSISHSHVSSQKKSCFRIPNHFLKLGSVSSHAQPRPSLQTTLVSVQEPVAEETQENSLGEEANVKSPRKSYVWVNPKSPRASQFRKKSYDSRYTTLVKAAESLNYCEAEESEVSKILDSLGSKVLEQDAVVVINNMVNHCTATLALKYFQKKSVIKKEVILYNVTMKVFRKCKNLEGAEKLFDEMLHRGVQPDNITFSTLISCARVANMPEKAVEWFEKIGSYNTEPDDVTYSAMIDAYGRAGNIEMAFNLYDRARSQRWRIDPVTFSTLIRIHMKSENYDGCLNVYEEMKAIGAKPNLVIYNTLLDAMGKARRPWQAKKIHQEMVARGFSPNWVTYGALLRAFGKARYSDDCINVYKEAKERGIEMNVILYNTVLAMCADVGYTDQAIEVFNDMKTSPATQPDSWTFSSMLTIYACEGHVEEAESTLTEMIESGFEPNIFVLTSLMQCYGNAKRFDEVVTTFDRLLDLGINPDERFCACLLNVMTQSPAEDLPKLAGCIEKAYPKLGKLVRLLIEGDRGDGAFEEEAESLFAVVGSDVRKAYFNCLIDICVTLGLEERALRLFEMGVAREAYPELQAKNQSLWSLNVKGLSLGAAITALHVWLGDLTKAVDSGEEIAPMLGIKTGLGKHKSSERSLAEALELRLREMEAPFHESPDRAGFFMATRVAVKPWLETRKLSQSKQA